MKLSIVSTMYKSEPYIAEFMRRICAQAQCITEDFEVILVDDGSTDQSLQIAVDLMKSYPNLSVIELSRNFGHHKAMMTGLGYAKGDNVFLIDIDLEEPPELLMNFYEEMQNGGWDVVYGIQKERSGGLIKRLGGRIGWWIIQMLSSVKFVLDHSTVRLMTAQYVRSLLLHKEHETAIGGLWVITGFRQMGIPFQKGLRGISAYTFLKRLKMLFDSVASFSERPLYGVFLLGCLISILSFCVAGVVVVKRLTGVVLDGWTSVMVSVWLLGGLILLAIGIVGLYVSHIFVETKKRPYTIVRKYNVSSVPPS